MRPVLFIVLILTSACNNQLRLSADGNIVDLGDDGDGDPELKEQPSSREPAPAQVLPDETDDPPEDVVVMPAEDAGVEDPTEDAGSDQDVDTSVVDPVDAGEPVDVDSGISESDAGLSDDAGPPDGGSVEADAGGEIEDASVEPEPECETGVRQCNGLDAQACVDGFWQTEETCEAGCGQGRCGECQPGAVSCPQEGVIAKVCSDAAQWEDDHDVDGVSTKDEYSGDTDADDIPNYLDQDDDNDGLLREQGDQDVDGIPSYLDSDEGVSRPSAC